MSHPQPMPSVLTPADGDQFLDAQKHALEMVVKGEPLRDVLRFLTSVVDPAWATLKSLPLAFR